MGQDSLDRHQLAGVDARERGFSRPVEFERTDEGYRAILRYEAVLVTTDRCPTQDDALRILVQTLQAQGYRQLRTQMSYRGGVYLGSQEPWVEYPDESQPEPGSPGFIARLLGRFRPRTADQQR
jgi:hypothetical protein